MCVGGGEGERDGDMCGRGVVCVRGEIEIECVYARV